MTAHEKMPSIPKPAAQSADDDCSTEVNFFSLQLNDEVTMLGSDGLEKIIETPHAVRREAEATMQLHRILGTLKKIVLEASDDEILQIVGRHDVHEQ